MGWILFGTSSDNENKHDHKQAEQSDQIWTCSMHPQIKQSEPGSCPICGMDLIPAERGADGLTADQFKMTENALALANVQTSVVGTSYKENGMVTLSGKVVENEESNTVQVSYFAGRIERLNVNSTGEPIRKGQLLATIYSPELFAAQQELLTASTLKESQPALYEAVRKKLKLWKLSDNQINEIEKSGRVKENFPVYATVSGTVLEKLVEEGASVKQGQPLLKIANLSTVWAQFDVYEHQINLFKKGQEIDITTNADPAEVHKAQVAFIDPVLDPNTRTLKMRAVLINKKNTFKPGMFLEGKISIAGAKMKPLITVPASAILWTGKRSVVYVKTDPIEPIFEMREVTLGTKMGDNYSVTEGLSDGDIVVSNGAFTVDSAAQLKGKKSMMNKEGDRASTGHEGHVSKMLSDTKVSDKHINERIKGSEFQVSEEFKNQLNEVVDQYMKVKNALVADQSKTAKSNANALTNSLKKVNMKLLSNEDQHQKWMQFQKGILSTSLELIESSEIEEQRIAFIELSNRMTNAIQSFGTNRKIYQQYCPMADNNKGASWLSLENKILNPYFGSAMLNCGSVVTEIN